jgi:hypothetical protein
MKITLTQDQVKEYIKDYLIMKSRLTNSERGRLSVEISTYSEDFLTVTLNEETE